MGDQPPTTNHQPSTTAKLHPTRRPPNHKRPTANHKQTNKSLAVNPDPQLHTTNHIPPTSNPNLQPQPAEHKYTPPTSNPQPPTAYHESHSPDHQLCTTNCIPPLLPVGSATTPTLDPHHSLPVGSSTTPQQQQRPPRHAGLSTLVAGVSSFAFMGTNAHALLATAPGNGGGGQPGGCSTGCSVGGPRTRERLWVCPASHPLVGGVGVERGGLTAAVHCRWVGKGVEGRVMWGVACLMQYNAGGWERGLRGGLSGGEA